MLFLKYFQNKWFQAEFDENSIIDVSSCTSSDDESSRQKMDDLMSKHILNNLTFILHSSFKFKRLLRQSATGDIRD